jgi:drug/metabolite transporter (DMT)-like permease
MHLTQTVKAYLALSTGILALVAAPFFVRFAQSPGPVTAFYRMTLATLIMLPFFIRGPRNDTRAGPRNNTRAGDSGQSSLSKDRPRSEGRRSGDYLFPLLAGACLAIEQILWSTGLATTLVANAALLTNISPLWVALGAWFFFREKLNTIFWFGLALALGGVAGVISGGLLLHTKLGSGDILCLLASFFYAGYYLATQRGRQLMGTLHYIWLVTLSAMVTLFIYVIVARMPLWGFSWQTYLIFLGMALITQITGYLTIGYAMGHLPAAVVSPTLIIQVVLTTVLAVPVFGEALTTGQWLSSLVVLAGIVLVNRSRVTPTSNISG